MKRRGIVDSVSVGTNQCHHYWIIEVANGPKSIGRCKNCKATREFLNGWPGAKDVGYVPKSNLGGLKN